MRLQYEHVSRTVDRILFEIAEGPSLIIPARLIDIELDIKVPTILQQYLISKEE
jgi:hypothetical protein